MGLIKDEPLTPFVPLPRGYVGEIPKDYDWKTRQEIDLDNVINKLEESNKKFGETIAELNKLIEQTKEKLNEK